MKISALTLLSALLITTLIACQKQEEQSGLAQLDMMNVSYGTNARNVMDVYLPVGRTTTDTKVILFIHGGSWSGGDKNDFTESIAALRAQLPDYAIFNMNYRLAGNGQNRYPAQMEDVQNAIAFIRSKAAEYNIDASRIGMVGASAGAHLALLHAYKNNTDGNIKAVVNLFGPTDLVKLYHDHPVPAASQPVLVNFLGATPVTNPVLYQQTSPVNFVTAQSAATLILHGSADFIVPISQSIELRDKLQQANAKVELVVYNGEGHGWIGPNLTNTYQRTVNFIKQNVK